MTELTTLWLPILLTAIAVFIVQFLAWVVLPHHKPDFRKFPKEDELLELIRSAKPEPGPKYMFPLCTDPSELKDPDKLAQWKAGPHGLLDVWPAAPSMGRNLPLMFAFNLVVGVFVAYLAGIALAPGTESITVFRFTATAAIMAFALGTVPNTIWFAKGLRPFLMDLVDNVASGLITGLVFTMLWPAAAAPILPVVG